MYKKLASIALTAILIAACSSTPEKTGDYAKADLRDLPDWRLGPVDNKPGKDAHIRERAFATFSYPYAIASDVVYEDPEQIPFPIKENWLDLKINQDDLLSDGFYARAWIRTLSDESKELVVTFRGTDAPNDFWNGNLAVIPFIFGTTQFDAAIEFTNDSIAKAKEMGVEYKQLVLAGHSLGGGLAQYVQVFTENSLAVVFNASPNKGRLYSLFSSHVSDVNSVRLYENGEVLKYFRWALLDFDTSFDKTPEGEGERTIWLDFFTDGAFDGHGIQDFAMALVKLAAEAGDDGAKSVVKTLKDRRPAG